ncbi:MAG: protein phosphatase 2C domain-containing protein [Cyanobacteriota bacterium]|nr:protein phosphatase 2C domain-containing protein [Cyanobacteriota bacterium]
MPNPAVMLHCSNTDCQAANPLDGKFCHRCRTPLVKRYLRALGEAMGADLKGKLVGDRYLVIHWPILLDTKPALSPQVLDEEIPPAIVTYLKLFPYRPHIPQAYGQLPRIQGGEAGGLWLLESGSLPESAGKSLESGQLFPDLTGAWSKASPLRQLNWLWQIAQLWQPLLSQEAASSLLDPQQLKVNGSIVVVQELQKDAADSGEPTLRQLGRLWSQWMTTAAPTLQPFFQKLCEQLRSGQIERAEVLVALLEGGLNECGASADRRYQIYAGTDTGPSRERNEDACYPMAGFEVPRTRDDDSLAIICDGVGGHEGGEIASRIAIDRVRDRLAGLRERAAVSPLSLVETIEDAVCEANDAIGERNDLEHRHERQRMGTTLVLTLARAHQMYLAHVGDSRIYLISRSGCYQMTLDDDWASWEVRLGYTCYRAAIQHYNAGALLQALGMSSSSRLRPTVNRFILDEDCVFLLCSDGLSDFDRVEQYWETEILPVLAGERSIEQGVERLIEIANRQNGHDNVTVTLVCCQVRVAARGEKTRPIALPRPREVAVPNPTQPPAEASASPTPPATAPEIAARPSRNGLRFALACAIVVLLGLGLGGLSYWLFPEVRSRLKALVGRPEPPSEPLPTAVESPPESLPTVPLEWAVGDLLQLERELVLVSQPSPDAEGTARLPLPPSTRLRVSRQQIDTDQNIWLQLQLCLPARTPVAAEQPAPLSEGWARADEAAIVSAKRLNSEASGDTCPFPSSSPAPNPASPASPTPPVEPTPE